MSHANWQSSGFNSWLHLDRNKGTVAPTRRRVLAPTSDIPFVPTCNERMPRGGRDSQAGKLATSRNLKPPARVVVDSWPHAPLAQSWLGDSLQPEHMDGTRAEGIAPPISCSAVRSACSHAPAPRHALVALAPTRDSRGTGKPQESHRPAEGSSHRFARVPLHRHA
jgi:hypothetical protein